MAERFNILQTLDSKQFSTENSAVQISAARILGDIQNGQRYLQVKFVNNGEQPVTGLDITVKSGDTQIAIQHFTNLNLKYGETSGSKTLIALSESQNLDNLGIFICSIQTAKSTSLPDFDSSNFSASNVQTSKPTGKLSIQKILLWISSVLLVISLALSFSNLFLARTLYVDDPYWYNSNLWNISSELSNMSYEGSSYRLPFSIPFGVYGYAISTILAILYCLFLAEKKRSTRILRVIPFLPFGFQLFLTSILFNRSFVEIYNEDDCGFVLRSSSFNNIFYLWLACAGATCLVYAAFLFITRQPVKKETQRTSKKSDWKKILLTFSEIIIAIILPLAGRSLAGNYENKLANRAIHASLVATNDAQSSIAERYGLDGIYYSDTLENALTKTTQANIEQFVEERTIISSSTNTPIGTLYCIGHIDRANGSNTYYRVFWKIMDPSIIEISDSDNTTASDSDSSTPNYAGYWMNGDSSDPYYLDIQVDSSSSTPVLEVQVYSDYYHWTATAYQSTSNVFTYENGFQQSHSEDFNLPDLAGTITFNFDKNTVTWNDDSGESIVFTDSISDDIFNTFVNKAAAAANSYVDNSQSSIDPIDLAGHYWCEQNSGDAYISMYSSPDSNQEVGNIEIYSQLEKANFSGILYSIGDNQYETIDELGNHWNLAFYGSGDSPAFELHYILPSGNYQSFGEYVLDEHYYS